ncbi:type VII secretion target [Mycobacteroides abscessus]|uniref:type VII secretion target n=1 Tax=Mycobacteroides abscessus TaxID=36809 RepID=UPI0013F6984F|nr:type VII secretion target [Mycobacteroides abscessus]
MTDAQSGITQGDTPMPASKTPAETHPAKSTHGNGEDGAEGKLDVDPAQLVDVSDQYGELATEMRGLGPKAAEEVTRFIATHGLIGYPAAVGITAGLAKAEARVAAKAADFLGHQQRFLEHAATYATTDAEVAGSISATIPEA